MSRLVVSPRLVASAGSDGALPILPNRQAARSLGVPYRSLEVLAGRTVEEGGLRIASKLVAHRLLTRASAAQTGSHDPSGFARAVEGTIRELLRAGVALEQLQDSHQPRIARLGRTGVAYLRELRNYGLLDSAELLWRAAELVTRRSLICLSGFPRLPGAEREFLLALAAPGSTVHLPLAEGALFDENREALEHFRSRGWSVTGPEASSPDLGGRLSQLWSLPPRALEARPDDLDEQLAVLAFADLEAEVRGTLGAVKRLLGSGVAATRIAIVARNEEAYGPTLLAIAEEYEVPFRALYLVPLARTRLGSWLGELMEVLGSDFAFESTARLLANPLVNALDSAVWRQMRTTHSSGVESWAEHVPALALPWPARAARQTFSRQLLRMLEQLAVRSNAVHWPREALAYQAFAEELRALPDPEREIEADTFAAEVNELLAVISVPIAPGRGGVELHTPLSLFGARFEHLFVVGAMEGSLPSPVRPDPLLDPFEREDLRTSGHPVETVTVAARREELSFWALLQSAGEHLTISYPNLMGRSETLASPYIARLGRTAVTASPGPICSLPELRRTVLNDEAHEPVDPVLAHARFALEVESYRESAEPADGHDGVTGVPFRPPAKGMGVSRLIDLASCPFKFFGTTLLRLAEPEEADDELDDAIKGQLYHRALHLALQGVDPNRDLRSAALAALEASFAEAEEELGLAAAIPSWPLERAQHLLKLRHAISGEDFIAEGARVRALETAFQATWRGIAVRGRVDRIDAGPDGLTFVDYKSGSTLSNRAKGSAGRAEVDLQLPVYSEAAEVLAPGEDVAGTMYYSLSKAKELPAAPADEGELEGIVERIETAWRDGAYPVDPDIDDSICQYCQFDPLCRRGPRLERKRSGS